MIETLYFVLQFIGVVILLGWAIVNDRVKDGAPVRGPLAYKDRGGEAARPAVEPPGRRGLTRP